MSQIQLLSAYSWSFKPLLLSCLMGLGGVYGRAWYQLRARGDETTTPLQPVNFAAGLLGLAVVTASPLDALGMQALFIARMFEYILLIYVLPHFFWAGIPARWPQLLAGNPRSWRMMRWLTDLLIPAVGFNLLFLLWHLPFFFEAALRHPVFNQLQLLILVAAAWAMWMPLSCSYRPLRLPLPRQMFYLVLLILLQVPVFAMLTFSRTELYPTYAASRHLVALSTAGDQQLGGWMLKTLSAVIFAAAFIRIFLDWNQRARHTDRQENLTAVENFDLAKRAPERKG